MIKKELKMDTVLEKKWEVYALKYAERRDRTRKESFIFDDHSHEAHTIDYFIWVLKSDKDIIIVDTGYDYDEAKRRNRPIQRSPSEALKAINIDANQVTDVIITHLHYDHAGGLIEFPNAKFHLQETEMAYATGPLTSESSLLASFNTSRIFG